MLLDSEWYIGNYNNSYELFEDLPKAVKKFLKEGYCRDIEDVPLLHDMFYSIDRGITYAKDIKEKYEDGYIIILDRYTISNAIYRLDKVKDHTKKECNQTVFFHMPNLLYLL